MRICIFLLSTRGRFNTCLMLLYASQHHLSRIIYFFIRYLDSLIPLCHLFWDSFCFEIGDKSDIFEGKQESLQPVRLPSTRPSSSFADALCMPVTGFSCPPFILSAISSLLFPLIGSSSLVSSSISSPLSLLCFHSYLLSPLSFS